MPSVPGFSVCLQHGQVSFVGLKCAFFTSSIYSILCSRLKVLFFLLQRLQLFFAPLSFFSHSPQAVALFHHLLRLATQKLYHVALAENKWERRSLC
jgi:hypothetical protein